MEKRLNRFAGLFLVCALFLTEGCGFKHRKSGAEEPGEPTQGALPTPLDRKIFFAEVRAKVFEPKCLQCHAQTTGSAGGVELETHALAVHDLARIERSVFGSRTMPPSGSPALTSSEAQLLLTWIEQGAKSAPETPIQSQEAVRVEPTFTSIKKNLFEPRCDSCHRTGGAAHQVLLSDYSSLIQSPLELVLPGNADESGLFIAVTRSDVKRMPPQGDPLTAQQIEAIRQWILAGAHEGR